MIFLGGKVNMTPLGEMCVCFFFLKFCYVNWVFQDLVTPILKWFALDTRCLRVLGFTCF